MTCMFLVRFEISKPFTAAMAGLPPPKFGLRFSLLSVDGNVCELGAVRGLSQATTQTMEAEIPWDGDSRIGVMLFHIDPGLSSAPDVDKDYPPMEVLEVDSVSDKEVRLSRDLFSVVLRQIGPARSKSATFRASRVGSPR